MKITRKTGVSVVFLLGICLLTTGAYAGEYDYWGFSQYQSCWWEIYSISDPSPVNLTDALALWDYRDTGRVQDTGAYYHVYVAVIPVSGSELPDHNAVASAVREIKVKHLQTGREFTAGTDQCFTFVGIGRYYDVYLQPEDWTFEGEWQITMIYEGRDHRLHRQTLVVPAAPELFPAIPKEIKIKRSGDYVEVSWDGIGTPRYLGGDFAYRLRIYDPDGVCADDYAWKYDTSNPSRPRIVSDPTNPCCPKITPDLIGQRILRLENRSLQAVGEGSGFGRAVKFLKLEYTSR